MKNNNIGYIICETASSAPAVPKIVKESNGILTIETILQDMEVKNRNGRWYSVPELAPQLSAPRMKELLESRSLFGEAGHPMSSDLARQQTVDPTNLSHLITKLWADGNDIKGYIEPASTRVGDDFKRLIDAQTKVAFSLRALGSVNQTKRGAEVQNIKIITWDWVIYPSHSRAYMQGVVNVSESVLSGSSNNFILSESDAGIFLPISNKQVVQCIKESSQNFKSVLESVDFMYSDTIVSENGKNITLIGADGDKLVINLEQHVTSTIIDAFGRRI